jgi:sulfur transfer protein SufE
VEEVIRLMAREGVHVEKLEEILLRLNNWREILRLLVRAGAQVENLKNAQRKIIKKLCKASFKF